MGNDFIFRGWPGIAERRPAGKGNDGGEPAKENGPGGLQ
jgi:hypothetical protein